MNTFTWVNEDLILLVARLIAGSVMLYYGIPKVRNLRANAADFVAMGFRPGWFWGTPIAFLEFFGGLMIIGGIFIWIPAFFFGTEMLTGTFWKATKAKKPFSDYSYDLLLFVVMLFLIAYGPGAFRVLP